ncbi:hypothetical protein G3I55_41095, partial [Streptomyces sp. SID6648]|nr:hypothetical protein [Streptomyces sp. SID6648]
METGSRTHTTPGGRDLMTKTTSRTRLNPIRADRTRALARLAVANRVSAVYLALVGGATALAAAEPLFGSGP